MKKWQKIVGIVSLAILAIINFVIYGLSDMQTIYKGHPSVERVLSDSHDALLNIGYLVLANYLIIVFLFICLWRKGTNKTIPSLIKIISVEKITLPFTFEKTYCRLGVFTENNGIERMEAYFVNYARKDAHDFASMFNGSDKFSEIKRLIITDKDFSEKSLADIRQFFSSAGRDDVAMLFYAGHGLLDKDLEYYLATSNVDFSNPFNGGVHYDNFVGTLDGISPLKKYCFIDACHSGEISKDDYIAQNTESSGFSKGYIVFRGVSGLKARKRDIENVNALLSEMFTDLRWGVGATVISSAAGSEFAIEGDEWGNGLFTYCLKETANNAETDRNGDGNISAEEWLKAASIKVKELSEGHQSPNLRSDNYHSSLIISSTKKK